MLLCETALFLFTRVQKCHRCANKSHTDTQQSRPSSRQLFFPPLPPQLRKEMKVRKQKAKGGTSLALSQCICFTLRSHNIAWLRLVTLFTPPSLPSSSDDYRRMNSRDTLHSFQQHLSSAQSSSCHLWSRGNESTPNIMPNPSVFDFSSFHHRYAPYANLFRKFSRNAIR